MTYKSLLGCFSSESTMFTSIPPRRLRWSAWATGRSSPNCVPAPYSGNVTSRTRQNRSQSDAPGPKSLSVSSAQKCSGEGRLATPSGVSRAARSAVPCRSSVPGHRASRSKYTRGQSQETGSLSKSPGGVGALAKRVLLGSAWADSGS